MTLKTRAPQTSAFSAFRFIPGFSFLVIGGFLAAISLAANLPNRTTAAVSVSVPNSGKPKLNGRGGGATAAEAAAFAYAWGDNSYGQLGNGTNNNGPTPVPTTMPPGVTFKTVSAGLVHSLALDNAGNAWSWGQNGYGQLGTGAPTDSTAPVAVSMPAGVTFKAVVAGAYHSLAIDTSGKAWAWGSNGQGELGNGGPNDSNIPSAVIMPPGVTFVAISGGFQWSLALDSTGNAWAWGSNTEGELGNGLGNPTNAPNPVPVPVMMPAGVTFSTVVAGGYFGVALDTAGKAWAWGYNYEGELGNGTTNQNGTDCFCSTTPAAVTMPAGVTFSNVSAGGFFTVALDSGGNAWAWGYNGQGELGNGATTDSAFPVQVTIPVDVTFRAIAAGTFGTHALALDTTGNAWGWGNNNTGDVGDGTTIIRTLPVMTSMPAGVTFAAVAAGGHHSLALVSALPMSVPATVLTWGDGNDGQTGNPAFGFGSITAIPLNSLTDITAVAGGGYHTVALKSDGTVWNWGCPDYPCSRNTDNLAPVQVPSLTEITSISAGFYFALALKSDGTVWAWGNNGDGQLGNGTTTDSLTPVEVMFPSGVTITSIAAGGFHGLAIDSTGLVWAWGYGGDGQLGNGTMGVGGVTSGDSSVPVPSLMTGATAIAGGYFSSYALKSDGTVWAWGYNGKGELGNGSTTGAASNSSTPSQVMGLTGVTAIAAGRGEFGDHAMALKSDGSVWGWGDNDWGQLGVGTNSGPEVCGGGFYCSSTPVQVTGLTNIITIGCGGHHGMATKSDGTVWAWGENSFGELGDGTATERDTPIQVLALSGVVALSPGDDHSVALGPPPPEIPVVSIVSRKNHSAAGTFDIDLTNGSGVECRSAGSNGSYMLIFKFANPLMNYTRADVTDGTATIASTFIANNDAHNAIVNLTGVTNAQVVTVTLGDVTDSAGDYSSSVAGSMGVLLGDVNGSRRVDAADVSSVRQQTLQTIDATNFRNDINASGRIDASDVSIARQQTLTSLP